MIHVKTYYINFILTSPQGYFDFFLVYVISMWSHLLLIICITFLLPWQHLCDIFFKYHHYVLTDDKQIKEVVFSKDRERGCKRTLSKCPCDDMNTIRTGMGPKCFKGFKHCNRHCCIRTWLKITWHTTQMTKVSSCRDQICNVMSNMVFTFLS